MNQLLRIASVVFFIWSVMLSLSAQNLDNDSSNFQGVRDGIHTVERGETLYSISRQYDMTVEMLKKLNKLYGNHIEVGQALHVILLPDAQPQTSTYEEPISPVEQPQSFDTTPAFEEEEASNQDFNGYPRTMITSVEELFLRQQGKLYSKVYSMTFDESKLSLPQVKDAVRQYEYHLNTNDFLVVTISGVERFLQADIFKYFASLPCKKLLILDLNFRYKHLYKQFQRWQNDDDLIVVLSSTTEANVNSYWKYGAISQALSEGLEGAADMDRDRMVRLSELDYYMNERVKELTGQNQYAYIPIAADQPLIRLEE